MRLQKAIIQRIRVVCDCWRWRLNYVAYFAATRGKHGWMLSIEVQTTRMVVQVRVGLYQQFVASSVQIRSGFIYRAAVIEATLQSGSASSSATTCAAVTSYISHFYYLSLISKSIRLDLMEHFTRYNV